MASTKQLPIGIDNFKTLIDNNYYFVDKTLMIRDVIHNIGMVNLYTRPRRFGKTLMMQEFIRHEEAVKSANIAKGLMDRYRAHWLWMRDAMQDRWEDLIEITLADGTKKWVQNDRLFIQDDSTPMNPDSLTDWVKKFVRRHDLPHFSPHSLRHTHASLLIAGGMNIPTVSRRLGHSSVATTTKVYVHAIQSADEIAADLIEEKLDPMKRVKKREEE